ncbi:MAG: tetratricopeptide repeat protein [Deltaproteobacteria bacterium]|nr:tetratricopeptide repeat protein [Deltaproteobacteria bacterium]
MFSVYHTFMTSSGNALDARQRRIVALGLLLLTLLAYLPALGAGLLWDDRIITDGPLLKTLAGLRAIWLEPSQIHNEFHYWPLFYTTLWLEHALWGDTPTGYHVSNLLLHALNSILAWHLLRRLRVPGALAAAALFALHPVHVEAAAWIFGRKDLLATALCLGSALCYLRFDDGAGRRWYGAALLLFGGALLSKSIAIGLPLVLLLVLWWQRGRPSSGTSAGRLTGRDGLRLLPLFALAIAYAAADFWFVRSHVTLRFDLTWLDRAVISGRALWFYGSTLLWPAGLTAIHPRWPTPVAAWHLLWPLTALALPVALFALRHRIGRGPCAAVCCFGVTLAPVLGLVDFDFMRYTFVADRFQYLASLSLIALAAATAARLAAALTTTRWPAWAAAAICCALLGAGSFAHARDHRDLETLFRANLARNPLSWAPYAHIGYSRARAGRFDQAIGWYRLALTLNPDDPWTHLQLAEALGEADRREAAIGHLQRAIAIAPHAVEAHINLGVLLSERGEVSAAVQHLERALALAPASADALVNLGSVLGNLGRNDEALARYRRALEIDPTHAMAHTNLAGELIRRGRRDEGLAHLQAALERDPGLAEAWRGLGLLRLEQRDPRQAIRALSMAVELRPSWADAHNDLGNALGSAGEFERAAAAHARVLALDPSYPRIHYNLALDQLNLGRDSATAMHLERALQLDRSLAEVYAGMSARLEQKGQPAQAALFRRALESQPAAASGPAASAPAR